MSDTQVVPGDPVRGDARLNKSMISTANKGGPPRSRSGKRSTIGLVPGSPLDGSSLETSESTGRRKKQRRMSKWALSKSLQGQHGAAVVPEQALPDDYLIPSLPSQLLEGPPALELLRPAFEVPPLEIWEAMFGQLLGVYFAIAVPFQTSFMGSREEYRSALLAWMVVDMVLLTLTLNPNPKP
jgi:hypothetical protein